MNISRLERVKRAIRNAPLEFIGSDLKVTGFMNLHRLGNYLRAHSKDLGIVRLKNKYIPRNGSCNPTEFVVWCRA